MNIKVALCISVAAVVTATPASAKERVAASEGRSAEETAQDNQSGEGRNSEDIIVTARRIAERLQDVPVAVSALEAEKLESLGIRQVVDIRQAVAGINITPAAGRITTPIYTIRGQRSSDIIITQDLPITVYLDEAIVTPPSGSNLGLFDLANVQVLKGPQGTLFGRNTTGGAVLFTTAKPTDKFEGSLRLGYGNLDTKTLTGVLNVPVSESVRLRGAVNYVKSDGFGRVIAAPGANPGPAVGRGTSSRDELSLRLSVAIDPTDWLKTVTTGYYERAKDGEPAFVILDTPNPSGPASFVFGPALGAAIARQKLRGRYDVESGQPLLNRIKNYGIIHTDTIELSDDLTFKNIFAYRNTLTKDYNDLDGTILPIIDPYNLTKTKSFSNESQLQGVAFDNRLDYVFGIYYFDQKGTDGTGFAGEPATVIFGAPSVQYGIVHNTSFSGFGQGTFKLTDTLNLSAGLRYTVDTRKVGLVSGNFPLTTCKFTDSAGVPLPASQCLVNNSKSFAEPSWLISLDKKLGPDTMAYIATRHSFRAGGFNLRANSNAFAAESFKPEKVTDLELGLKTSQDLGTDVRLTANIAAYYQWYSNIQRNVSTVKDGQIGNITKNAAKAHVYGGEAEFDLRFGHNFGLSVNYAYVNPKYDSYPTSVPVFGVPNQPDDYSDYKFVYIPKHQLNANLTVSPDLGDLAKVNLIASLYYQSSFVFSEDQQTMAQLIRRITPAAAAALPNDIVFGQKGYALVNLRAEFNNISNTGLSVAAFGRNVLNKRYLSSAIIFTDSVGINSGIYGEPRTYGIEATFKF